jgi:hypothetical protein
VYFWKNKWWVLKIKSPGTQSSDDVSTNSNAAPLFKAGVRKLPGFLFELLRFLRLLPLP